MLMLYPPLIQKTMRGGLSFRIRLAMSLRHLSARAQMRHTAKRSNQPSVLVGPMGQIRQMCRNAVRQYIKGNFSVQK